MYEPEMFGDEIGDKFGDEFLWVTELGDEFVRGAPPPQKKKIFGGRFLPNVGGWGGWFPNRV